MNELIKEINTYLGVSSLYLIKEQNNYILYLGNKEVFYSKDKREVIKYLLIYKEIIEEIPRDKYNKLINYNLKFNIIIFIISLIYIIISVKLLNS